jgi:hypothetical protein
MLTWIMVLAIVVLDHSREEVGNDNHGLLSHGDLRP